jgi:hypothetical protein
MTGAPDFTARARNRHIRADASPMALHFEEVRRQRGCEIGDGTDADLHEGRALRFTYICKRREIVGRDEFSPAVLLPLALRALGLPSWSGHFCAACRSHSARRLVWASAALRGLLTPAPKE